MASLGELFVTVGVNIDGFKSAMAEASNRLQTTGASLTSFGAGLTGALTVPLLAVGTAAIAVGLSLDAAFDKIRIGTGATGPLLASLQTSFTNVFAATPSSAADVETAIADLNTRLGLAGPGLEAMATQVLTLSRLTGTDLQTNIAAVTRVFGDWTISVAAQSGALDYLFLVSQATGIEVGALSQTIVQFGAPLRQMGFDFEEAAALIGKFEQEGVNMELVLGAMRIALTRMAKEGIADSSAALDGIIQQIKDAGSAGEANAISMGAFGAKAGPDMAAAIREGRFEIGKLVTTLKATDETIMGAARATDGFEESLQKMKNQATLALAPLGTAMLGALSSLLTSLQPVIGAVKSLGEWFAGLSPGVQQAILVIGVMLAALGPFLVITGQVIIAVGAIGAAMAAAALKMGIAGGALGLLGTAFSTVVLPAIIAVTVAMLAWKIGEWAYENIPGLQSLADGIVDLTFKIPGLEAAWLKLSGVTGAQEQANSSLDFVTKKLETRLAALGVTVERGSLTTEQYNAALREKAKELSSNKVASDGLATATRDVDTEQTKAEKSAKKLADKQAALNKTTDALATAYGKLGLKDRKNEAKDYSDAIDTLKTSGDWAKLSADDQKSALDKLDAATLLASGKTYDFSQQLLGLALQTKSTITEEDLFWMSIGRVNDEIAALNANITNHPMAAMVQSIVDATNETAKAAGQTVIFKDALGALGITGKADLEAIRNKAIVARDAVLGSDLATDFDKKTAVYKALKAQVDYAVKVGEEVPEEQAALLAKMDAELGDQKKGLPSIKAKWGDFSTEVSTIITNFAQDISKSLWEGDTSWGEKGKKLLTSLGEAITSSFITPAITAVTGFITSTLEGLLKPALAKVGGWFASAFSGGDAIGGIADAAGGVSGAAGGVSGAAGAVSGAAGAVNIIGAATGVVSAVSDIIGNFQSMAMNKTLDLIENSTRYTKGQTLSMLLKMNEHLPGIDGIHLRWQEFIRDHAWRVHDVWAELVSIHETLKGGGAGVNVTIQGNVIGTDDAARTFAAIIARDLALQGAV